MISYSLFYGIQTIRNIMNAIAIKRYVKVIGKIDMFLWANNFFGFSVFIGSQIYRFSFSGRYCSGDLSYVYLEPGETLEQRGNLLIMLIIFSYLNGVLLIVFQISFHSLIKNWQFS